MSRQRYIACAFPILATALFSCSQPPRSSTSQAAPHYSAQVVNPDLTGGITLPGSHITLLWGTDGSILRSVDTVRWTYASTPVAADLNRIAANVDATTLVAAGKHGTLLRSEDSGQHWTQVGEDIDADIRTVVHDPGSDTWMAAGTQGMLLRSTDDARHWQRVPTSLNTGFEALFADPRTGLLLIGGEDGVVGTSSDAGASWHLTWIAMSAPVTPITSFHRHGDLLLATSALGRFLISRDDARSWDLMQSATRAFFTDVAADPRRHALVMIGHDGTVLRSTDDGHSWQADVISRDRTGTYLSAVHHDARSGCFVVAGHGGTLARSCDAGATWRRVPSDMTNELDGVLQTSDDTLVTFGKGGLVAASADAGEHWTIVRNDLDFYLRNVAALADGSALVATGQLGDILQSHDGLNWQRIVIGFPDPATPPDLRALAVAPAGRGLIAAGPPGAILRSDPHGSRWTLAQWSPLEAGRAFAGLLADNRHHVLVAVEAHGALQVSHDGGDQWREVRVPTGAEFWHGAVLEREGVMVIAGKAGVAARSSDAGSSWTAVDTGSDADLFGSFAEERSGSLFLLGAAGTLLRSRDTGLTWERVVSATSSPLRRMMRDARSGALLAFGGHGSIVRSGDGGATWEPIDSGVEFELRQGLFERETNNLLIVGRGGTVLRSSDGGRTWQGLPAHTSRHFTSIATDRNGNLIAVGERIVRLAPGERS